MLVKYLLGGGQVGPGQFQNGVAGVVEASRDAVAGART